MEKILILYDRLNAVYVKQRILLIYLIIQNTILSLVMLIFANVIISNAKINGELDYTQIKLFYTMAIIILYIIILIFAPIFLSRTLNNLYEKNVIDHLLSVRIDIKDIVYAVYFRGLLTLITLLISSFPIVVISFYFGGIGLMKMIRIFFIVMSFALFFSSACIFISTRFVDENVSSIVSYSFGLPIVAANIYFLSFFINGPISVVVYVLFNVIISLILVSMARKTTTFNA